MTVDRFAVSWADKDRPVKLAGRRGTYQRVSFRVDGRIRAAVTAADLRDKLPLRGGFLLSVDLFGETIAGAGEGIGRLRIQRYPSLDSTAYSDTFVIPAAGVDRHWSAGRVYELIAGADLTGWGVDVLVTVPVILRNRVYKVHRL